jgi:hypothetical protein
LSHFDAEKKRTNHDDLLTDFIISYDSLNSKKCPVSPITAVDSSWVEQCGMPDEPTSLPSTSSFEKLAVRDADFGTTKIDAPLKSALLSRRYIPKSVP